MSTTKQWPCGQPGCEQCLEGRPEFCQMLPRSKRRWEAMLASEPKTPPVAAGVAK